MKILVIGGSGLIGTKLITKLQGHGHQVSSASPSSGVDAVSGAGLAEAMTGIQVVVDVTNSPSFEDAAVLKFFETSTGNLLSAETAAGVGHHVALSIVGAERLPNSGYMRAKLAQEKSIKAGTVPYTILRATQFFEFIGRIADEATEGSEVRLSSALMQPVAADDVVAALADVTLRPPVNGMLELAGPEPLPLDELARRLLSAKHDKRHVTADIHVKYFGQELNDQSLVPGHNSRIGAIDFESWLRGRDVQAPAAVVVTTS